jgi:hypothetical protein
MQDQLATELVKVSTVSFMSRSPVKNWLATEGCGSENFVYFMDTSSRGQPTAPSRPRPSRASSRLPVMTYSFEVDFPVMFGREISLRHHVERPVAPEPHLLPRMRFARRSHANHLPNCHRIRTNTGDDLIRRGEGSVTQMLDDSVTFLNELSSWISNHYNEVRTRSEASAKECGLISHCVRTVLSAPSLARSPSHGPYPEVTKASSLLWGHCRLTVRCSWTTSRATQK